MLAKYVQRLVWWHNSETWMRWKLVVAGTLLVVLWLVCWAATVVPESSAVTVQWAAGNALAFLAGTAFGAAMWIKRRA
jgi:hypothetical protein